MAKQLGLFDDEKRVEIQKQIDEKQDELDYDTRDYPIEYLVDLYNSDEEKVLLRITKGKSFYGTFITNQDSLSL